MNCPRPTKYPQLNAHNRLLAIREAMYGPVRVTFLDRRVLDLQGKAVRVYWKRMARRWGLPLADAIERRCGNCAAFDTSPQMVACGGASSDGEVGYCHAWNFTCAARRTCLSWSPAR